MPQTSVLIVDDEPMALTLLEALLRKAGADAVTKAGNGEEALAALEAAEAPPDVVITDIDMPVMDGWSLARRIRMGAVEAAKDVPIFMLTANDSDRNQQKAAFHKIDGYLVKPPTLESVTEVLAKL